MTRLRWPRRRFLAATLLAPLASACSGRRGGARRDPGGVLTVSTEQQASWVRNFNPLLAPGNIRWPTRAGIYEPLFIYDTMGGKVVPWLSSGFTWGPDKRTLHCTLRPGVTWSDGQPFTADDVVFTFEILQRHKALDLFGVWSFLDDVRATAPDTVVFSLNKQYVPGLVYLGHQPIVPRHVWRDVPDPVTFTNERPVATGPFTEITVFQNQVYELGRNPRYWQPGKPALRGLRFPAYPGNDQATLALLHGEVDWAGNFVPDVERIFVARDPAHHHYWFPLVGGTVMLYPNAARAPLSDERVRKAISMSIDRALLVKVAMYGYTRAADATGLHDGYARFRSPEAAAAGDWISHDMDRAGRLLDEAGYPRRADGLRASADGAPLTLDVHVVTGWSDWIRAAQIIAQGLRTLGVTSAARAYDFSAFFEKLQKGAFDLSLGWSSDEPTPYHFYRDLMGTATLRPLGEPAARNWHRFGSEEADALLAAFEGAADEREEMRLSHALERLFATRAPVIPLFPNPSWAAFNTRHFEGFPSVQDPYAKPSPYSAPECLLVLTRVTPRGA
ncbi:MAG TPA: ABC transporter substrate-binding protein [Polyangium sp.]|nr:ABC transporter substrate-binding protein [Polyangium sp.]